MLEAGRGRRGEERAEGRTLTLKEVAEEGVTIIREVVPLVMEELSLSGGVLALLAVKPSIDEDGVAAAELVACGAFSISVAASRKAPTPLGSLVPTFSPM